MRLVESLDTALGGVSADQHHFSTSTCKAVGLAYRQATEMTGTQDRISGLRKTSTASWDRMSSVPIHSKIGEINPAGVGRSLRAGLGSHMDDSIHLDQSMIGNH